MSYWSPPEKVNTAKFSFAQVENISCDRIILDSFRLLNAQISTVYEPIISVNMSEFCPICNCEGERESEAKVKSPNTQTHENNIVAKSVEQIEEKTKEKAEELIDKLETQSPHADATPAAKPQFSVRWHVKRFIYMMSREVTFPRQLLYSNGDMIPVSSGILVQTLIENIAKIEPTGIAWEFASYKKQVLKAYRDIIKKGTNPRHKFRQNEFIELIRAYIATNY